jgi:hypothetical protein
MAGYWDDICKNASHGQCYNGSVDDQLKDPYLVKALKAIE